jgi:hypothetical protein
MQPQKTHWFSILILTVLGISASLVFLISFGLGINSMYELLTNGGDPAGGMISSFAFGLEFILLLLCSWFVLQKVMGRERAEISFNFPFAVWQIAAVIGVVVFSAVIGGITASAGIAWVNWIILPTLTILVIVPPIWMFIGLGARGIDLGPRWRVFSVLGLGMTVGPLIMIVLEMIVLLGVILIGMILVAVQKPDLFQEIVELSQSIQLESDPELIISILAPYITTPAVIAAALGYIALLVPMIEELLKPLAVWIFAGKIESPAQGFVMGMISGAAFALIESLNASGDSSASWPIIVSVRAGTSLLHITASGLVGWGIVSAFRENKIARFFAAYFSAVAIHGIWNACAIGAGISIIGELIGKTEWIFNIIPAAIGGMTILGFGIFAVLIASNRKLTNMTVIPKIASNNDEEIKQTP